jgi:hypothetical protein
MRSSGEVSYLTKITYSPFSTHSAASWASNTILPIAPPGEAGRPVAKRLASTLAKGSIYLWRSWLSWSGSIIITASFLEIKPSLTKSTANFKEAWAVLLPFLV